MDNDPLITAEEILFIAAFWAGIGVVLSYGDGRVIRRIRDFYESGGVTDGTGSGGRGDG